MIRYKLTKSDKDFPVGTPVFIEIDDDMAYIEYYGEQHRVFGFRWSFLKAFGYKAEVDE